MSRSGDDPFTGTLQVEETATENLSVGGALLPTSLGVMKGETVRLHGRLEATARVVGLRSGEDGRARLRLRFIGEGDEGRAAELLRSLGLA